MGKHSIPRIPTAPGPLLARTAVAAAIAVTGFVVVSADSAGAGQITPAAAPKGATQIARDAFNRTASGSLGRAEVGGTYAVVKSAGVRLGVSGGAARLTNLRPGTGVRAVLASSSATNTQLDLAMTVPKSAVTGGALYVSGLMRSTTSGALAAYRALVKIDHGAVTVKVGRVGTRKVTYGTAKLPGKVAAGRVLYLRGSVVGTTRPTLSARAWLAGQAVPGKAQVTASDASGSPIRRAGAVGVLAYASGSGVTTSVALDGVQAWRLATPGTRPPATKQPGPANTGVPAGTALRKRTGDWTISKPGVYSGWDVHGFVRVTASNVTIRNSILRGGFAKSDIGLVNVIYGTHDVLIEDSEIVPEHPSAYLDGVTGWGYTLRRVDIHGTVDGAKIFGNNTTITRSWIHDLSRYASDPNQGGRASHNDNVQVLGGRNVVITANTLTGATNAALQVTQTRGPVVYLNFSGNWAGRGACTVNLQDKPLTSMSRVSVSNNRFAKNSTYGCAIIAYTGVSFTHTGNVWLDGTSPVTLVRRAG